MAEFLARKALEKLVVCFPLRIFTARQTQAIMYLLNGVKLTLKNLTFKTTLRIAYIITKRVADLKLFFNYFLQCLSYKKGKF